MKRVTIYTDGGCEPNPGRGGIGVVMRFGERVRELACAFHLTTNNRAELLAVITALEALNQPCRVTLYSDSRYIVDAMETGAAVRWRSNGWMRTKKARAKNADLWDRLLRAAERHEITFKWVKGHSGVADNELCDALAEAVLREGPFLIDEGYRNSDLAYPSGDLFGFG